MNTLRLIAQCALVLFALFASGIALPLVVLDFKRWDWTRRIFYLLAACAVAALFVIALTTDARPATLSFTLPSDTQPASPRGEAVDCAGGTATRSLAGWRIFAQIQSPTWVRERATMLADESRYAALWPRVGNEAFPRQIKSSSSKHLPGNGAGTRITTTVPDSLDGMPVLVYWVETFNDSGQTSCPSNLRIGRFAP